MKAEREAKEKAEREAKLKAEKEAKLKAEKEAKLKAEKEAKLKAEKEAKLKAEKVGSSWHGVNVENQLGLDSTYGNAYHMDVGLDGKWALCYLKIARELP